MKKLLSITDVSIESIVEVYRKSHTIKFSTPNVDVKELKATAIGSSGCEAFVCENGPCTKHSITMNANSGLGSFELGQYFRLSLSFTKSNCALCERYGNVTTEPIDWQAGSGDTLSSK